MMAAIIRSFPILSVPNDNGEFFDVTSIQQLLMFSETDTFKQSEKFFISVSIIFRNKLSTNVIIKQKAFRITAFIYRHIFQVAIIESVCRYNTT